MTKSLPILLSGLLIVIATSCTNFRGNELSPSADDRLQRSHIPEEKLQIEVNGRTLTPYEHLMQMSDEQFSYLSEELLWYYIDAVSDKELARLSQHRQDALLNANPELNEFGVPALKDDFPPEGIHAIYQDGKEVDVLDFIQGFDVTELRRLDPNLRRMLVSKLSSNELSHLTQEQRDALSSSIE